MEVDTTPRSEYKKQSHMGPLFDEFFEATPQIMPQTIKGDTPPPTPPAPEKEPEPVPEPVKKEEPPRRKTPSPIPVEDYSKRLNSFFAQASMQANASRFPSREEFVRGFIRKKYTNKCWRETCDVDQESSTGLFKMLKPEAREKFEATQTSVGQIPETEGDWPRNYTSRMVLPQNQPLQSARRTSDSAPPVKYSICYNRTSEMSYLQL
jgi:hypothetical protein